jgi:hypothetical protein
MASPTRRDEAFSRQPSNPVNPPETRSNFPHKILVSVPYSFAWKFYDRLGLKHQTPPCSPISAYQCRLCSLINTHQHSRLVHSSPPLQA